MMAVSGQVYKCKSNPLMDVVHRTELPNNNHERTIIPVLVHCMGALLDKHLSGWLVYDIYGCRCPFAAAHLEGNTYYYQVAFHGCLSNMDLSRKSDLNFTARASH